MERGIWIYPWDLAGEGITETLTRIRSLGFDSISLAASYHSGRFLLPHNPTSKLLFAESALYLKPEPRTWVGAAAKPRISGLAGQRVVEKTLEAAGSVGLRVGAWVVCLHNSYIGSTYPALSVRNAFGDRLRYSLCPSKTEVLAYTKRLLASVCSSTLPFDTVQLESPNFLGVTHGSHHELFGMRLDAATEFLLGLCFCEDCCKGAQAEGIDAQRLQHSVRALIDSRLARQTSGERAEEWLSPESYEEGLKVPGLARFLHFRVGVVSHFIRDAVSDIDARRKIQVLVKAGPALWKAGVSIEGLPLSRVEPVILLYARDPHEVSVELERVVGALGDASKTTVGLRIIEPDCPDPANLEAKVQSLIAAGVSRFIFYNYGLASEDALEWVPRAFHG